MSFSMIPFGKMKDGRTVTACRLENGRGMSLIVLDYGATVQSLVVPDRNDQPVDVVLGYDSPADYQSQGGFLGATIGRMANRVGGAAFSLNGKTYRLSQNDGENHLHGGDKGFDKQLWQMDAADNQIVCSRLSPDGEEHYPGNLKVRITFTLTENNALQIAYDAETDADTIVNLTNHSYFNLSGGGSILHHQLRVSADRILENDSGCLPTGKLLDVKDTPFDFRHSKPIGQDIGRDDEQLRRGGGYDHNFILGSGPAAVLQSPDSGIRMTVTTSLPGMQVYTANSLSKRTGKGGRTYVPRDAVCLETQLFPNAMNCYGFPSPILHAGQKMHSKTEFAFDGI